MSDQAQRTPLYDLHVALGAKMVDFAGWSMPLNYGDGIIAEHKQCREKAALFDVSHMGQALLTGARAPQALETLVPSAIADLKPGKARYTVFTKADGGILDDLIVSRIGEDALYAVVNASRRDHDFAHMRRNLPGVAVEDMTDHALIALQGPAAEAVLGAMAPEAAALRFMETTTAQIDGALMRISRLGYTGEDGYEISVPADRAEALARALLDHRDCAPAGLGARDTLRLEAGLCLYGDDIDETTSPIEAGLGWLIQKRRREEGGFPGAERILKERADGAARRLVGVRPDSGGAARAGVVVASPDGNAIGAVTSGGFGPTIGGPISLAYVDAAFAEVGAAAHLLIRGKSVPARVVETPFVPHNYKR